MADKKISELTAASTPLAGTEVLPIVQSGSTVKVSAANVTAGRAVSALTYTSTVATGTAPLVVASTTEVANLRAANATSSDTANAVKSNATTGVLQVVGPAAASTRVMTTPDANFTAARTDAGQTFVGVQDINALIQFRGPSGVPYYVGNVSTGFADYTSTALRIGSQTGASSGSSIEFYTATTDYMSIAKAFEIDKNQNLKVSTSGKGIVDTNGNESLMFTATASAVNELTVANAATGNRPAISATGSDTNIGISLTPKGSGNVSVTSNDLLVGNASVVTGVGYSGVGSNAAVPFVFYSNGTERGRINSTGSWSIGSTAVNAGLDNVYMNGVYFIKATAKTLTQNTANDFVSIAFDASQASIYTKVKYQIFINNSGTVAHEAGDVIIVWRSNNASPAPAINRTYAGTNIGTFTTTQDTANNKLTISVDPGPAANAARITYSLEFFANDPTSTATVVHI